MVRRRIDIELIQDKPKRHTTFTKRRKGLEKKTRAFCDQFRAEAAVLTVSQAGNGFGYGNPTVDKVLDRYLQHAPEENNGVEERVGGDVEIAKEEEEAEPLQLTEAEKRIVEEMENGKWEEVIGNLELKELDELEAEIRKIKSKVVACAQKIAAEEKNASISGDSSSSGSFRS